MNTGNIEQVKLKMKILKKQKVQEKELKKAVFYLPEKYEFDNLQNEFELNIDNGLDYLRTCIECEINYSAKLMTCH